MNLIFGAHGLAAPLAADAARGLIDRMGLRAAAAGRAGRPMLTSMVAADGVAFGVCQRQFPGEPPPALTAQSGALCLATQGRLDNRAELMAVLGLPAGRAASPPGTFDDTPSDTALILAAYQRFGVDVVQHLVGDWVFALWDAAQKRLLLARDASGISALYWWQGDGHLLFATGLQTLMASGRVPARPNARWIAGLLTVFTDPAYPGATAFEGVHAVPPGHLLVVQAGRAEVKRWWKPETLAPLIDTPLHELESRVLTLYDDAVRKRLRRQGGSVAATLSGGLDSGSVVALAAPALAEQRQRLAAYVHTPLFDAAQTLTGRIANEWSLALATARHVGQIDVTDCPTAQLSPLDGIRRWLDAAGAPLGAAANWYWLQDIAEQASAAGARVLLNGHGGNATVSFTGNGSLWPRVRALQLAQVAREVGTEQGGWPVALWGRLVKPVLRPAWHQLRRAWTPGSGDTGWTAFALLKPSLAAELRLESAMRHAGHDPGFASTSARRLSQFRLGLLGGADNGNAVWAELGWAHGLEMRDPTRDQRLVELCWQLPDELFWAHGRRRGLIRSSMRHKLPPQVVDASGKGQQSADLGQRLSACGEDLLAELSSVTRHDVACQWIDMDRLVLSARAAMAARAPVPRGAVPAAHALQAMAAAMFIARHA